MTLTAATIDTDKQTRLRALELMATEETDLRKYRRNIYAARRIAGSIERVRLRNQTLKDITYYIAFFGENNSLDDLGRSGRYYVGTMLAPKRDPLGRLPLVDARWFNDTYLGGMPYISLTWTGQPDLGLGAGYMQNKQESYDGDTFTRCHTPVGVKMEGAGFGTALYSSLALYAYEYLKTEGVWSPRIRSARDYTQRTAVATRWWTNQIKRGFAQETMISDDGTAIDYLRAENVVASGLLVYGAMKDGRELLDERFPLGVANDPRWTTPLIERNSTIRDDLFFRGRARDDFSFMDDDTWASGGPNTGIYSGDNFAHSPATLELLPRAYHPSRPYLAGVILDTLARQDESKAVEYATRPDVALLLAKNPKAARLVQRGATPGLSGLSNYAHREMLHAIASAALSDTVKLSDDENPLHFAPLSKQTERLLTRLSDE